MDAPLGLDDLLKFMTKKGASDLHLKPTRPPLLRLQGRLVPIKSVALKPKDIEEMVLPLLNSWQHRKFEEHQSVDIGYGVAGVARFRCNIFQQRGSIAAVFRRIPFDIKNYDDLLLPEIVATFSSLPPGLVLVTGPTGSGKSTTLAAIIQDIARTRPCHVVTIEDPIEFLFTDHMATVSQREVGTDTPAFREALRNTMRQDPDVIMVGEMRDLDTVSTVITAAETGHLVFSTLHTGSASQTIDRIIDLFPADQQGQVRSQLAQVLRAVVSMQLVNRADGQGLVPAVEVLVNSPRISRSIEHGEIKEAQREGTVAPSPADFASIIELMEIKRLYEEQEERWKQRTLEKDELLAQIETQLAAARQDLASTGTTAAELRNQLESVRAEKDRVLRDAEGRIEKLNERIRELNQQMGGAGKAAPEKPQSGFFKR